MEISRETISRFKLHKNYLGNTKTQDTKQIKDASARHTGGQHNRGKENDCNRTGPGTPSEPRRCGARGPGGLAAAAQTRPPRGARGKPMATKRTPQLHRGEPRSPARRSAREGRPRATTELPAARARLGAPAGSGRRHLARGASHPALRAVSHRVAAAAASLIAGRDGRPGAEPAAAPEVARPGRLLPAPAAPTPQRSESRRPRRRRRLSARLGARGRAAAILAPVGSDVGRRRQLPRGPAAPPAVRAPTTGARPDGPRPLGPPPHPDLGSCGPRRPEAVPTTGASRAALAGTRGLHGRRL